MGRDGPVGPEPVPCPRVDQQDAGLHPGPEVGGERVTRRWVSRDPDCPVVDDGDEPRLAGHEGGPHPVVAVNRPDDRVGLVGDEPTHGLVVGDGPIDHPRQFRRPVADARTPLDRALAVVVRPITLA
ncbi:hypothetical protein [Halosegnis sp.]|uniref:hypothetical protein n=1 Tax=Halosegnis sp. TaxID=2864959 RepID=UPI0035D4A431